MRTDLRKLKIGILGTGRLGRVLAQRLSERYAVSAWDIDVKKAKQVTKQCNLAFVNEVEQLLSSDLVLLCIPAPEVIAFFRSLPPDKPYACKFVSLATEIDTEWVIEELRLQRLSVIGLKLIGQFSAIRYGIPAAFVTSHSDPDDVRLLNEVFKNIGKIHTGDERKVREINLAATRLALRFCLDFAAVMKSYIDKAEWEESALKSVALGTILDYPPDSNNAYTAKILKEMVRGHQLPDVCHPTQLEVGR